MSNLQLAATTMAMIEGKAHAFICRYDNGDCFDFELIDTSLQALVDTLDKIYPFWHDATQSIAKRELI